MCAPANRRKVTLAVDVVDVMEEVLGINMVRLEEVAAREKKEEVVGLSVEAMDMFDLPVAPPSDASLSNFGITGPPASSVLLALSPAPAPHPAACFFLCFTSSPGRVEEEGEGATVGTCEWADAWPVAVMLEAMDMVASDGMGVTGGREHGCWRAGAVA